MRWKWIQVILQQSAVGLLERIASSYNFSLDLQNVYWMFSQVYSSFAAVYIPNMFKNRQTGRWTNRQTGFVIPVGHLSSVFALKEQQQFMHASIHLSKPLS